MQGIQVMNKTLTRKTLKQLRQEKGATLEEMANLLGLKTPSAYWKKENLSIPFSLEEAHIIANYFHKSIEDIFFVNKLS